MSGFEVALVPLAITRIVKLLYKIISNVETILDHRSYTFHAEKARVALLRGQCEELERWALTLSLDDEINVKRAGELMQELLKEVTEKIQERHGMWTQLALLFKLKAVKESVNNTLTTVQGIIDQCLTTIRMSPSNNTTPGTVMGSPMTSLPGQAQSCTSAIHLNFGEAALCVTVVTSTGVAVAVNTRTIELRTTADGGIHVTPH